MKIDVIFSGFGGQGALLCGQLLAQAGMLEGKQVTYLPVYGSEVRGGTAFSIVMVSDDKIYYPYLERPTNAVVFNLPSLDKYEPLIAENGLLIVNSSLVNRKAIREGIRPYYIPGNTIAKEIGSDQVLNIVMFGAFVAASQVVSLDSVMDSLKIILPERRHNLLPMNREALERGAASYRESAS